MRNNFARVCSSARTDQSHGVGNNSDKAVAAIPSCAIGFECGNLSGPGKLGPDLEIIQAMFDAENPGRAGGLVGDSYAAVLESHPRYPSLRSARDAALLARLDRIVEQKIKCVGLLRQFGFDELGISFYHAAALNAWRTALPTN